MSEGISNHSTAAGLEIAIIGMACRFPGADDIDTFLDNLKEGTEFITFFKDEELEESGIPRQVLKDTNYVKAFGILKNKECFDASFFGYTPTEAGIIDPQVWLFHECAWEALENGGYYPDMYKGLIGLYAGASPNPKWEMLSMLSGKTRDLGNFAASHLYDKDYLTLHVSHKLNLTGPSFTFYTACSTSLVAVHLACQAILNGECDMALAGGVSITHLHNGGYPYQEGMVFSPDGHCRAFDAKAEGMVGGEGAGIVLLKRLEDAVNDRDHIYALIKGSSINNDGIRKPGFTAPSVVGQAEAIKTALDMAEVEPETIGYIEAHGTATHLGDPVEVEALIFAFNTGKKGFCAVGSLKTNIGHLDSAAGVAGLIKTALILKNKFIPPSLHFQHPNPKIDFANSPFYVNATLKKWKRDKYPLRAGVSSFGVGGTNAHVILEEAADSSEGMAVACGQQTPDRGKKSDEPDQYHLILLSAKTRTALEHSTGRLVTYLKKKKHIDPANVSYTLQVGRKAFQHRRMLVCPGIEELIDVLSVPEELSTPDSGQVRTHLAKEGNRPVIFMFSGQGSQYVNMGKELYEKEPVFQQEVDRCIGILEPMMECNIKKIMFPVDHPGEAAKKMNDVIYSGPIKFTIEYSLAKLLIGCGVHPHAMIGHSFGEYAAACLSGVFSLQDALKLVVLRGKLMQKTPPGVMMSVPLSPEQLKPLLMSHGQVSLAAVNTTSLCIVSGPAEEMAAFENELHEKGYECLPLNFPRASHSKLMASIAKEFEQVVARVKRHKPQIPYISGLTGNWIKGTEAADPGYWSKHLREPVLFLDGLNELLKEPETIFIQMGCDKGLPLFVGQHDRITPENLVINLVRHPKDDVSDVKYLFNSLGQLWLCGVEIDWSGFHMAEKRERVPLPTYPFEDQRFRIDGNLFKQAGEMLNKKVSLTKKQDLADWFYTPAWKHRRLKVHVNKVEDKIEPYTWLVFIDEYDIGSSIVKRLLLDNQKVIKVKRGPGFNKIDDHTYIIDPREFHHYHRLINQLWQTKRTPTDIVHLWSLAGNVKEKPGRKRLEEAQVSGFYSLLFLAKSLAKQNFNGLIKISVLTNGIQNITGEEPIRPEQSTVLGPVKVIPQEYPNIKCYSIDIELPDPGSNEKKRLVNQLYWELRTNREDIIVALRNQHRWVEFFEPVRLEEHLERFVPVRENGVYLIIGGLGNVGAHIAKHLAKSVKAQLVLTGLSAFPARGDWDEWLSSHDREEPISRKIRIVKEIEGLGARVLVLSADVANPGQMREVIGEAEKHFGPINGVLHSALVSDEETIVNIDAVSKKMCEKQFHPKISGLLTLHHVLQGKKPDFCLIASSVASILGGLGHIAYSAANIFIDKFVLYHNRANSVQWKSVNWDVWESESDQLKNILDGTTLAGLSMTPQEGVKVFHRVLAWDEADQVINSTGDLQLRIDQWINLKSLKDWETTVKMGEKSSPGQLASFTQYPRPNLANTYGAPRNHIEETIAAVWKKLFGYSQVGIQDNFFQLGGDSLKAMSVIANIHKELNVRIPLIEFFKNQTIEEIAKYIKSVKKERHLSIEPTEKKEYYKLSSAQKRLYFIRQMYPDSTGYNLPMIHSLGQEIKKDRLESIVKKLISRHENFRTSFKEVDDVPVQQVHDHVKFEIEYYDLQAEPVERKNAPGGREPAENTINKFIRAFDLSRAPLLRSGIVKLPGNNYIWMTDMHHIISDGVSQNILTQDFMTLIDGNKNENHLPPLRLQYKDYSQWQNDLFRVGKIKEQEEYWLNLYGDEIPKLDLITDYPRPIIQSFKGGKNEFVVNREDTGGLKKIGLENDVTLFICLLTVLNILFYKYSGQDDIIVGCDISGRHHADMHQIIGMFVNMLPMRNYPRGDKTFLEFLKEVKENSINAFENQDMQFEELVDQLNLERDTSRNPLFDVGFVVQNVEGSSIGIPGGYEINSGEKQIIDLKYNDTTSIFDISLDAIEIGDEILFIMKYCSELFKWRRIQLMGQHFINILKQVVRSPGIYLSEIDMISQKEKEQILFEFNHTKKEIYDECYHRLFEAQARKTPTGIAIRYKSQSLSYKQLDKDANRFANDLYFEKNIRTGHLIGVYMDRSINYAAVMLGTMKVGGVYVPLETSLPGERLKNMIDDGEIKVVISQVKYRKSLEKLQQNCRWLDELLYTDSADGIPTRYPPPASLNKTVQPGDLAYIVYTSGTTGKPKGAMIHNRGMINHLYAKIEDLSITGQDIIAQTAAVGFDISIWQFLAGLLVGASIFIIDRQVVLDHTLFLQALQKRGITVLESVPSLLTVFLQSLENESEKKLGDLRWMILTGERLSVELVKKWYNHYPGIKIVNAYGPTEAADDVTHYIPDQVPPENQMSIPIGKPLQNLHIYILDKDLSLCPPGVKGEICISGIGVGKGYWKDNPKTAAAFIPNPFIKEIGDEDYAVLYKTGDSGYFRDDGNIECLGRMDQQVKIRGNRIELGEIEGQLKKYKGITDAIVIDRQDADGNINLYSYYTPSDPPGKNLETIELREYLSANLPDYMIPAYFVQLDKIPLTPNGKIDRKALPAPAAREQTGSRYEAPRTRIEEKLIRIWSEVLAENQSIGIHDNFFQLGGHSLRAAAMAAKIHKAFDVKIPLVEIFKTPTIKGIAKYIQESEKTLYLSIKPVEKKEFYPASSMQERLFLLNKLEGINTAYNLYTILIIDGEIHRLRVEKTFNQLVKRQESLRTFFQLRDGRLVQMIHDDLAFQLDDANTGIEKKIPGEINTQSDEKKILKGIANDFIRPFDLKKAPLFRVGLVCIPGSPGKKYVLCFDIHHIISDGISLSLLVKQFVNLYQGKNLQGLRVQYKDFSQWQDHLLKGQKIIKQEEYWLSRFSGAIPVLDFPTDFNRPAVQSFDGDHITALIGKDLKQQLDKMIKETRTTLYMVLLAVYNILLSRYSGQEDIIIGTPVAGRENVDFENIIGVFINVLAMRNYPQGKKTFSTFLKEVKENTLNAFENQLYPFGQLIKKINIEKDFSRNPLYDAELIVQNYEVSKLEIDQLKFTPYDRDSNQTQVDLGLMAIQLGDIITIDLSYCTKLYRRETMTEFVGNFQEILTIVLENQDIQISDIKISHNLGAAKPLSGMSEDGDFVF